MASLNVVFVEISWFSIFFSFPPFTPEVAKNEKKKIRKHNKKQMKLFRHGKLGHGLNGELVSCQDLACYSSAIDINSQG